jgi:threonine/homoserine/homoserine lactone efflux protein
MGLELFLRGAGVGFCIAAPVGPIGVLCIRRSLSQGQVNGFVCGLGAATADALYGSVAAFGLTLVSNFLVQQQVWLGWIGGLFLCYLGVKSFLAKPAQSEAGAGAGSLLGAYTSTLFLTLTNPSTILSFLVVFAALGLGKSPDPQTAGSMVLGVFAGSAAWWLALSSVVALARSRVSTVQMRWINRLSGIVLFGFGVWAVSRVVSLY